MGKLERFSGVMGEKRERFSGVALGKKWERFAFMISWATIRFLIVC